MLLGQSGQAVYLGLDAGRVFGPSIQSLLGDKMAVGARGRFAGLRSANPAAGFSLQSLLAH